MEDAIRDIQAERLRQIDPLGYTFEHDDELSDGSFEDLIAGYLNNVDLADTTDAKEMAAANRLIFVKIGALCLAAIEASDRRG